jgi:predicted CopG family antitoxin
LDLHRTKEIEKFKYGYSYCVHMGSVNISIRDEAYRFLRSLKQKDKSFSDVILEFKKNRQYEKGSKEAVLQFAGVLKDKGIDWKAKEKRMKEFRDSFNKRVKETSEYMKKSRK